MLWYMSMFFSSLQKEYYPNMCICNICSSLDGHLDCVRGLAFMNNTAMKRCVQVCLQDYVAHLDVYSRSGITRIILILIFLKNCCTGFTMMPLNIPITHNEQHSIVSLLCQYLIFSFLLSLFFFFFWGKSSSGI